MNLEQDMNFCLQCKHYRPHFNGLRHQCLIGWRDPVTGAWEECESARRDGMPCGPNGKLFEQRIREPMWWEKLFA